jgi:hypothetical protein
MVNFGRCFTTEEDALKRWQSENPGMPLPENRVYRVIVAPPNRAKYEH